MELLGGKSEKDRIIFYNGLYSATAIRNENNEIETVCEVKKKFRIDFSKLSKSPISMFAVISIIKVYGIIPLIRSGIVNVILYLLPAMIISSISILTIISVRYNGKESLLRNHAAEHKVFRACEKLKRCPTIEEAKEYSRIVKNCGITIYSAFIISQVIGFIGFWKFGYKISEIFLFLIPLFLASYFPFNILGLFAQFFTTKEPMDENLELAIAAISALEDKTRSVLDFNITGS